MRQSFRTTTIVAGGIAAGVAMAAGVGSLLWNRETDRVISRLDARDRGDTSTTDATNATDAGDRGEPFSERLAGLPAPVARYLELATPPGRPSTGGASVEWEGEFRMRPDGRWMPFTARQRFTMRPPGFVWDASIRMAPFVTVRVRDSYLDGEGAMRGAVAALVPVVNVRGTPGMAARALARYLGEAVWFPAALLPGDGIAWAAVDDSTARATLADGEVRVSVDFHFGPDGEVVGVSGERYRDVDGTGVLTPWRARLWDHGRVNGVLVPRSGEVEWVLPEGPFAYWRGRAVRVAHDRGEQGVS